MEGLNIEAYDADSLRKMVRLLEYENKILKDKLKKAGISYEEVNPFEEKIESAEEYDLDQGNRIVNPPYITEKMAIRFFSMFWGREDVYARRGKNGGYFPQCANRWNDRLCPKQRKEKVFCDECENTKWISLDVKKIIAHLLGTKEDGSDVIGVYNLISTSKVRNEKLMISVLSAVAEIERENILVQTMEGRKQKAREGKWNGGFAPYGYELVNGELQIAEDEAEIIRLIYDKFIHTNMGISAIAAWLNQHGYKKKKRQNNTLDAFAASFIKGVLDNPVYCGKLAYGRRKNEKVSGTRNEYRIVKQENYMLHDGIHEGIISETDWELAHQKREKTGVKYEKTHSLDHEHILSGILRCPLCGSGMYGNVNRKKKKDGTLYKDYFYYACKHRRLVDGHKCGYRKQWSEEKINNAVEEVIRKLVKNPKFEEAILNKIGSRIDTEEIEKEIEGLEKQHRQLTGAKARLGQQMDSLDIMDKFYEKKYQDMETRLYRLYDEIEGVENSIEEVKNRLLNIQQQKISEENVYQFLLYFDKLYDKFTDLEKKEFLNSFVEQVDIYEQEQPDGRFLKHIKFRFPVYFGDRETQELCWDNESTVETICKLVRK